MLVKGNKLYLRNIEEEGQFRFFDTLPSLISEGSVSIDYRRNLSAEDAGRQAKSAIVPVPFSGVFEIAEPEWNLHWREEGKQQLVPFAPDPDLPTSNTTVVLSIRVRITAAPTQLLEDMELAVAGRTLSLPPGYWQSKEISMGLQFYFYFYFDIPPLLPYGKHPVKLIAKTFMEGTSISRESSLFEVVIARTYTQLHSYLSQRFPNPS